MNRIMKRSIVVASLLIIALLVSVPGSVLAKATTTAVTGRSDLTEFSVPPGSFVREDSAGNTHFHKMVGKGSFSLHGDGVDIDGKQTLVMNGNVDGTHSGFWSGAFSISVDIGGMDTVIWEGHFHGQSVGWIYSGTYVAQGRGPYEGMQLKLDYQEDPATPENPDPQTFTMKGQILTFDAN